MTSNYNIKLVQQKVIKNRKQKRTHFHITKKDNEMIDIDDIQLIYNQFLERGIEASRIGIVGLNGERLTTLKGINTDDLFNYFDDDYLDGKSSEIKEKLTQFFHIELLIY